MRKVFFLIVVSFIRISLNGQNTIVEFAREKSTIDIMVKNGLKGIINDSGIDFNHYSFVSYSIPNGDSINMSAVLYSYGKDEMARYFTIILKKPVYYKQGFNETGNKIFGKPTIYRLTLFGNKFRIEFYNDSSSGIFRTLLVGEEIQDARTGKLEEAILGRGWTINMDEYAKSIEYNFK
jgi:hypothetical protein